MGWNLANVLQHPDNRLQISNMENRQRQLDIPKMPIAYLQNLTTSFAEVCLARDAHARVKRAVLGREVVARYVEEGAVADFEDTLLYYVLTRAL